MTVLRWVNYALCPPSSQYEALLQVKLRGRRRDL